MITQQQRITAETLRITGQEKRAGLRKNRAMGFLLNKADILRLYPLHEKENCNLEICYRNQHHCLNTTM